MVEEFDEAEEREGEAVRKEEGEEEGEVDGNGVESGEAEEEEVDRSLGGARLSELVATLTSSTALSDLPLRRLSQDGISVREEAGRSQSGGMWAVGDSECCVSVHCCGCCRSERSVVACARHGDRMLVLPYWRLTEAELTAPDRERTVT